jgi:DNA-binding GntR family transcriptional regulator
VAINHDGSEYLYLQLADVIRSKCSSGEWPPDTRIPSITEMMAEYDLSDRTVRQAIAKLVDEGILITRPGRGTYVCP